jgi:hypothetical protein
MAGFTPLRTSLAVTVSLMIACGGGTPAPAPTAPTSPTPSPNQTPQIVSATISPSLGVRDLTTFTAHVDARDPDADPLSVSWSGLGTGTVGTSADLTFKAGEQGAPLTVRVTDSKGATASAKIDFVVGDLNRSFDGYWGGIGDAGHGFNFFMDLVRTGTTVTGTFTDYLDHSHHGSVDSAEPGQIDAQGRFRIRFKVTSVGDFTFTGQLVPYAYGSPVAGMFLSNYAGTGRVTGGEFDGRSFTFGEHNPY